MRAKESMRNAVVAVITNAITILIGFVAQKVFSMVLGQEYLGINGLFGNIVSMLGIIELGFGSAVIYNLYKPIAENNIEKIKSLMQFYKKIYRIIASCILVMGILIIPFLKSIVGEVSISESIYLLYILYLVDTIVSYLLSYKRSILYANQKTYIVNIVHIGYLLVMNILQMVFLLITKNYILYLIIKIISRLAENIVLTLIVNKKYTFLKGKAKPLDVETKKDIEKKIKALFFHKIGDFIVKGTDNIVISKFVGIVAVGLYSGYSMIINALNLLVQQIYDSITASIGNLLIEESKDKSFDTYKKLEFFNFWLASFMAISFYCIVTPFVKVWLGEDYLLPNSVVIVLSIYFYLHAMRKNINAFKTAAGIFYEDRFMPLAEAIVNIVASIILVNLIGLPGVFIGTIISTLVLFFYGYPKYVYFPIFGRKKTEYIRKVFYYFFIALIVGIITVFVTLLTSKIGNNLLEIVLNAIICIIVPNTIFIIIFHNKEEFKFFKNMIVKILNNLKNKVNLYK